MPEQPLTIQVVLIIEASRSHSDTPHPVRLLWMKDQPDSEDLTTHKTRNGQTSMPPAEFEPTIPANERPQTHALDLAGHQDRHLQSIIGTSINL